MRRPSLAVTLRSEIKRHSNQEMKAARLRLRRMQKQITELRRQAVGQARAMASMRRRLGGLKAGLQGTAGTAARGARQMAPPAIRAVRDRLRMTREQFAKLMQVSPGSIFGWETGRSRPRRGSLSRLKEVKKLGLREARARVQAVGRAARGRRRRR